MNTNFHKLICTICMTGAMTGCSDWDDHYENLSSVGGVENTNAVTLWQQLKNTQGMEDFCEVLEQTKVYRLHKKTPVSYAQLLNSGQSFTVVAPLHINKDSLLTLVQTNEGDSLVERTFIQNHLSRTLTSVTEDAAKMRKMNFKRVDIGNDMIQGQKLSSSNIFAQNGILHIANNPLPYMPNIYEALYDDTDLSVIGRQMRSYNKEELDPDASVSDGIIDGIPHYVDSVVYERNRLLERVGLLEAEDSTYLMVVPSATGWTKAWNEALDFFDYGAVHKADSLQLFYTTSALLEDAVFNMTNQQRSWKDSLYSEQYDRLKPEYHVFYKPFEKGGILDGAQSIECSNGTIYKTDEWSYTPEQTYYKRLRTEAEQQQLILKEEDKLCVYFSRNVVGDSISEHAYLEIRPKKTTDKWEMTFRVNNTLSTKYNVYAIVLPKKVSKSSTDKLPNKFKATIRYTDVNGDEQTYNCVINNKTTFENDTSKVDTIMIAENFPYDDLPLPACNYDQEGVNFKVTLKCDVGPLEGSRRSRTMYLDCIYLTPCNAKSEEQ